MLSKNIMFFIKVVECGSFSRAAKRLYISQSAVSQQITKLEEHLNVKLFDRTGYIPELTEAGEYYYNGCKKILDEYESIKKNIKKLDKQKNKKIRIGIIDLLERESLINIVEEFKKVNKDISIEFKKLTFEEAVSKLEEGEIDISFSILNEFNSKKDIRMFKLIDCEVCIICSKKHHLAKKCEIYSREVSNEPIISFSDKIGKTSKEDYIKNFEKDGFKPNIVEEVEDLEELILHVEINKGIALLCKEMIRDKYNIEILTLKDTNHKAELYIGCLEKKYKDEIKLFIDLAVDFFERHKKN